MFTYRLQLADGAVLQADKKGDVFLQLRDVLYEPKDIIPRSSLPKAVAAKQDARSYVLTCCIYEFGPNHSRWPELARSFVDEDGHFHPAEEKALRRSHAEADAD
jgi:hypothetical protein